MLYASDWDSNYDSVAGENQPLIITINLKIRELTVENAPSPSTFPNLKSSGLFFFAVCGFGDVGEGAGEDVELELRSYKLKQRVNLLYLPFDDNTFTFAIIIGLA